MKPSLFLKSAAACLLCLIAAATAHADTVAQLVGTWSVV
jgi:hypothetical protein